MARAETDSTFAQALHDAMLSFRCAQDADIENFLHEKAIPFSDRRLCAVYLLLNETAFEQGKLRIEAYFTLSRKSVITGESAISKSKIQKFAGFKTAKTIDFVLIGQLGKHVECLDDGTRLRSSLTGEEILDYAFEIIRTVSDLIPCPIVLVECNDHPKVRKTYEDYGFTFLQKDGIHNQYGKPI